MACAETLIFENLWLRAVADALLRRRKAIRYHATAFTLERGVDRKDGVAFERLELSIHDSLGSWLQLILWEDSSAWVYLNRRETNKSRLQKAELRALLWGVEPAQIVVRVERSLRTPVDAEALRGIWPA